MPVKMKPKPRASKPRTTPRVTHDEGPPKTVARSAAHNEGPSTKPATQAMLHLLDGELYISAQLSEHVPVAQFAGVTIGPLTLAYKLGGVQMEKLLDVAWPEDPEGEIELTEEQAEVFDRVFAALQVPLRIMGSVISTDRTSVEISVRRHNQREEENKDRKTTRAKAKTTKPSIGRKK